MLVAMKDHLNAEVGQELSNRTKVRDALKCLELLPLVDWQKLVVQHRDSHSCVVLLGIKEDRILGSQQFEQGLHLAPRDPRDVMFKEFVDRRPPVLLIILVVEQVYGLFIEFLCPPTKVTGVDRNYNELIRGE